jgi:hypothetical protein
MDIAKSRDSSVVSDTGVADVSQESVLADTTEVQTETSQSPKDEGPLTFAQRVDLVRETYQAHAAIAGNPPESLALPESIGLGERSSDGKVLSALPWHPLRKDLTGAHDKVLSSQSGGLKPGAYLKKPGFKDSAYRISGSPTPRPTRVPESFLLLQPAKKQVDQLGLKLTPAEVKEQEIILQRSARMVSHQEWFLGTTRILLQKVLSQPDTALVELPKAYSTLLSGIHANEHLQEANLVQLHNLTLRKRDAFLQSTLPELSTTAKRELRQHTLTDTELLFDRNECTKAHKALLGTAQVTLATQATRKTAQPKQTYQAKQKPQVKSPARPPPPAKDRKWEGKTTSPKGQGHYSKKGKRGGKK